jgi:hypothetical protein
MAEMSHAKRWTVLCWRSQFRAHQVLPKKKRAPIPSLATCPLLAANYKMTKGIYVTKWVKAAVRVVPC